MNDLRKVVVQRSGDSVHLHAGGPMLKDNKSYRSIVELMGWGGNPIPDLRMSVPPPSPPPSLFAQSYVPPLIPSRKAPALPPATSPNPRPLKRRGRVRVPVLSENSDSYPSSSSSASELPSPRKVLAMVPETSSVKSRFVGKRKTATPTYTTAIWPREKACCVHACGGSSADIPSSTLYSVSHVLTVRSFWYELSTSDRRQFIANRMEDVHTGGDKPMRRYYIDTPAAITRGLAVSASPQVLVCACVCVCVCVCVSV